MRKWRETKKEVKRTADGVETTTTQELKPSVWEGLVKQATALAIFIPLVVLYAQYLHNQTQKTSEDLSQLYVNIALDIETLRNSTTNSKAFQTAADNLPYKYIAKIAVFKIDSLNERYAPVAEQAKLLKIAKALLFRTQDVQRGYFRITYNMITNFPYHDPRHPEFNHKTFSIEFPDFLPEADNAQRIKQIDAWHLDFQQFDNESYLASAKSLAKALHKRPGTIYERLNRDLAGLSWYLTDLKSYLKNKSPKLFEDFYGDDTSKPYYMTKGPASAVRYDISTIRRDIEKIDLELVRKRHQFEHAILTSIKK